MNRMQDYIDEQPEIFLSMLRNAQALAEPFVQSLGGLCPRRLVLIGSGSSYHAALMAKPVLDQALQIEVTAVLPTRLADICNVPREHTAFIAISQSGNSANTLACMRHLQAEGASVTVITADADSPVATAGNLSICLPIGEESIGAKTKGMLATALLLTLLGIALAHAAQTCAPAFLQTVRAELQAVCAAMEDNIARAKAWCASACEVLAPCAYLDLIAQDEAAGAAMEGRLKLLETIYRPVVYYEFEEYLHGIQNALSEQTHLLALLPDQPDERARMCRLLAFARTKGASCYAIGRGACSEEPQALALSAHCGALLAGFELLPALQTLSAQLSSRCGIDVTKPKYPEFYGIMKSKLRV